MCKKRNAAIISVIFLLIGLTIFGSFCDYEIAIRLYRGESASDNLLGITFAFIGVIPTFVGWSFLGASILCLTKKQIQETVKRRWLTALSIVLFALSFFYFCNTLLMVNANAFTVHWAVAYSIGVSVLFLAAVLGFRLSKRSDNPELLKKLVYLAIVGLLVLLTVALTKRLMARPRFRFVMEAEDVSLFKNWWENGREIKASHGSLKSDSFSSFPSGHSAYAMFAIFLFPVFADFIPKLEKYHGLLFVAGFVWWLVTAYSRLSVGAHYLSDVCVAGLIVVLIHEIAIRVGPSLCCLRKNRSA